MTRISLQKNFQSDMTLCLKSSLPSSLCKRQHLVCQDLSSYQSQTQDFPLYEKVRLEGVNIFRSTEKKLVSTIDIEVSMSMVSTLMMMMKVYF